MSYHTPDSKKEEFRRYLERSGAIDSLTSVLVGLYEEPDRPLESTEYIRKYLSGEGAAAPGGNGHKGEKGGGGSAAHLASQQQLHQDNEKLRKENKELRGQIKELNRTIETLKANLKHAREEGKRARHQQ